MGKYKLVKMQCKFCKKFDMKRKGQQFCCHKCWISYRTKNINLFKISRNGRRGISEHMKKNNPMNNPVIKEKARISRNSTYIEYPEKREAARQKTIVQFSKRGARKKTSDSIKKAYRENPLILKQISATARGIKVKDWRKFKFSRYDNKVKDKEMIKIFKEQILKRDKNRCIVCKTKNNNDKSMISHHIDYNLKNNIMQNGATLCSKCHGATTWNRKYWIEFLRNILRDKYKYRYEK